MFLQAFGPLLIHEGRHLQQLNQFHGCDMAGEDSKALFDPLHGLHVLQALVTAGMRCCQAAGCGSCLTVS